MRVRGGSDSTNNNFAAASRSPDETYSTYSTSLCLPNRGQPPIRAHPRRLMTKQGSWGVAPDSAGPLGLENYTSKVARGHRPESYLSANPTARQLPGISGNHQSAAKPVSISLQVGGQAWTTRHDTSLGHAGGLVGGAPPRARDALPAGTANFPPGVGPSSAPRASLLPELRALPRL